MAASSANILALVLAAPEAVGEQLEPVHTGAWTALTVGMVTLAKAEPRSAFACVAAAWRLAALIDLLLAPADVAYVTDTVAVNWITTARRVDTAEETEHPNLQLPARRPPEAAVVT